MSGEIIRQGDPTSHGGRVLEGSQSDICHGKPIAYIGHKTSCPLCKGTYPIVEGVLTTTFYGRGVALAGMKTACGATLIATQFMDIVEWGGAPRTAVQSALQLSSAVVPPPSPQHVKSELAPVAKFDLFFLVKSEKTGEILSETPYRITLEDGREFKGITDKTGHTQKVYSDFEQAATIEVPYYDHCHSDAPDDSDACRC